jgi:hypothetical protein
MYIWRIDRFAKFYDAKMVGANADREPGYEKGKQWQGTAADLAISSDCTIGCYGCMWQ